MMSDDEATSEHGLKITKLTLKPPIFESITLTPENVQFLLDGEKPWWVQSSIELGNLTLFSPKIIVRKNLYFVVVGSFVDGFNNQPSEIQLMDIMISNKYRDKVEQVESGLFPLVDYEVVSDLVFKDCYFNKGA